jgi:hypothetical protein
MLIRELITGSAAGFTVLAISVALMTVFMHYDDVRFLLKQIDSQTIGQHVLNVPAQAIAAPLGVSTVEGEGGFLIAEDLSEAVPPAPSVPASSVPVTVPIDSDPNSPAVSPDDDEPESDKKDVNYGTNKAGNTNSSYNASENSYDKTDKENSGSKS